MIETAASKITELSISHPLGDMWPENIYDIITWCRDYDRRNKYPVDILKRFAIGFYQISQGMNWKDGGVNKYEGYAAGVIHFIIVAEKSGICVDNGLDLYLKDFKDVRLDHSAYGILMNLSTTQQMLFYAGNPNNTKRNKRYDPAKLSEHLGRAIFLLICAIPKEVREEAFNVASKIMTKELK